MRHPYAVQFKQGDRVFGFLDTGFPWKKSGKSALSRAQVSAN